MPNRRQFDEYEARIRELMNSHGWALQGVFPSHDNPDGPSWTYTIGLWERFGHPEIVVFGIGHQTASAILNELGERVRRGETLEVDRVYDDVVRAASGEPSRVQFVAVPRAFISRRYDYFNVARRIYDGTGFEVIQLVWPDTMGRLPWEEGFEAERFATRQPILSQAALDSAG